MMKRFLLVALLASAPSLLQSATFAVNGADAQPWVKILGSVGISHAASGDASIVIAGPAAQTDIAALAQDHFLVLEGMSPAARSLGIMTKTETIRIRQIRDTHAPAIQIFWETPIETPFADVPADFRVFAFERWKNAPLIAGKLTAHGAIL